MTNSAQSGYTDLLPLGTGAVSGLALSVMLEPSGLLAGLSFALVAAGGAASTIMQMRRTAKTQSVLSGIMKAAGSKTTEGATRAIRQLNEENEKLRGRAAVLGRLDQPYLVIDRSGALRETSRSFPEFAASLTEVKRRGTDPETLSEEIAAAVKDRQDRGEAGEAVDLSMGQAVVHARIAELEEGESLLLLRDVTAERVAEAMMDQSFLFDLEPDGTIRYVTDGTAHLLRRTVDELIGRNFKTIAKNLAEDFSWGKVTAGEYAQASFDVTTSDDTTLDATGQFVPVRTSEGELVRVLVLATRREARKGEGSGMDAPYGGLLKEQAFIEFSPEGEILDANDAFLDAMRCRKEDIVGKHHSIFVHDDDQATEEYRTHWSRLATGQVVSDVFRRRRYDHEELFIIGWYTPIKDETGKVVRVVKMAADVTRREQERRAKVERDRQQSEEIAQLFADLRTKVGALAEGDLTATLEKPFPRDHEQFCQVYNDAVTSLAVAFDELNATVGGVTQSAQEISGAAEEMSKRTESQAATLEQSAAALEELTSSVKGTAARTKEMTASVNEAAGSAQNGGEVVEKAVGAMRELSASSNEISQIIGLIDDIAFQTNLLALNAGVEAARAGDAGRGFAVVASEVRALAQRSSEAAKQIKDLISKSVHQVGQGVNLVDETGTVLTGIVSAVEAVRSITLEIAASASEQAQGLSEVNVAVNQLDQVTQQNAAMVEETTAVGKELTSSSSKLARLMGGFRTNGQSSLPPPAQPSGQVHDQIHRVKKAFATSGNAALAEDSADDDWTDF